MSHNDTIVAQATPPGRGGVGILRISGLKARDVAQEVLGKLPKPRYAGKSAMFNAFLITARRDGTRRAG